jgi:hypothetical protein
MTIPHPRTNGRPSPAALVPPSPACTSQQPIDGTITGAGEEWGPLVRQPAASPAWRASSTAASKISGTPASSPTPPRCGKRFAPSPRAS